MLLLTPIRLTESTVTGSVVLKVLLLVVVPTVGTLLPVEPKAALVNVLGSAFVALAETVVVFADVLGSALV